MYKYIATQEMNTKRHTEKPINNQRQEYTKDHKTITQ